MVSNRPVAVVWPHLLWYPVILSTCQKLEQVYRPAGWERHPMKQVGKATDGWRRLILEAQGRRGLETEQCAGHFIAKMLA